MTRIEFTGNDIQIDAQVVAMAFAIGETDLKQAMRDGTITSRVERGEGEDAVRYRLNFFSADRRVQVVARDTGEVLTCDTTEFPVPGTRRG
jgi:hypothetical protein